MQTPNDIEKKLMVELLLRAVAKMAADQTTPEFERWAEGQR